MIPRVLIISGIDPTGGAGLGADVRVCSEFGAYPLTIASALTVQNQHGFRYVQSVAPHIVIDQLVAVYDSCRPDAVKIGLMADASLLQKTVDFLTSRGQRNIVVDPVLSATAGADWSDNADLADTYRRIAPEVTLMTPNVKEAQAISLAAADKADKPFSYLLTGGDEHGRVCTDILYEHGREIERYELPRVSGNNLHGSGCILSTAIAVFLAKGCDLHTACCRAKIFAYRAITQANTPGMEIMRGYGPAFVPSNSQKLV